MRTLATLTRAELRLFLREPMGVFFAVAFPTILIGILGSVPAFREPSADFAGLRVVDLYATIAVTLIIAMVALQGTPAVLANYRERGILRRFATTPVKPVNLLIAQLAMNLLVVLVATVLVLGVARTAFAVPLPRQFLGFVVALGLTAVALFAIGLFIAAVVPNGKAANAVGTILFFPVMFFAGLWVPRESLPKVLQTIGDFTPLGAGERALHDVALGSFPHIGQLAVLVAYGVVFGVAAARLFRWE
jgi:ABC-2 type transport system permease protein